MVKLYAGEDLEAEAYTVHKEWACNASPILDAAFNSDFLEGQTQTYRLEVAGIDGNVVKLLVSWIYTQTLELKSDEPDSGDSGDVPALRRPKTLKQEFICLVKLWILADKLLMPRLQNAAMYEIETLRQGGNIFPLSMMKYIYENTANESPLRDYTLQHCATTVTPDAAKQCKQLSPEFLFDLIVLLKSRVPKEITVALDPGRNMDKFNVPEE